MASDRHPAWLLGDRGEECDHVGVLTDATVEQIRALRCEGLAPKLIARKLSLPLRDVSLLVSSLAAERGRSTEVVGYRSGPPAGAFAGMRATPRR